MYYLDQDLIKVIELKIIKQIITKKNKKTILFSCQASITLPCNKWERARVKPQAGQRQLAKIPVSGQFPPKIKGKIQFRKMHVGGNLSRKLEGIFFKNIKMKDKLNKMA